MITIAALQMKSEGGNVAANLARIEQALRRALTCDVLHYHRKVPSCAHDRRCDLSAVVTAVGHRRGLPGGTAASLGGRAR